MSQWKKSSQALIDTFLESTAHLEGIERKKMFGYHCCFLNGNMFTGLHEENWVIRLPVEARDHLFEKYAATPFAPMGRVMKEYVAIPQLIQEDCEMLRDWLDASHAYVSTLPPKKKKAKAHK